METLLEKIVSKLTKEKEGKTESYVKGLEQAIYQIQEMEKNAEFEEVARVMMKHLGCGEKYHPHHSVIISNSTAQLVEGKKGLGIVMDYVPD